MPGNTADNTTLAAFIARIEAQYGRSDRIWIMDRGIPTEETLAEMRASASGLQLSGWHTQRSADPSGASSICPGSRFASPLTSSC